MSFDKARFKQIVTRLNEIEVEEATLLAELQGIFNTPSTGSGEANVAPAKAPKAAKAGDMKSAVIKAISSYTTPKTLAEIVAKVGKQIPNPRPAAVGAVLAGLAKSGRVLKPTDSTFFMPQQDPDGVQAAVESVNPADVTPVPAKRDPFAALDGEKLRTEPVEALES